MKTGVVDVGGGLRGAFGAGVFDFCMDRGIHFDYAVGVSAGAGNIAAYQAGQFGRNYKFYTEYSMRKEYMSIRNYLRTHSYVDLDYVYGVLASEDGEYPFDYDTMMADPAEFLIVATDAETGKPVYFNKSDMERNDYGAVCASSCVPVINKPYIVYGRYYYDGGIADPIPYEKAIEAGCDRTVVILTRPRDQYRAASRDERAAKILSRTFPEAGESLRRRAETYNRQLDEIKQLEKEGSVLIIAPDDIGGMKTLTRDVEAIKALYRKGLVAATAVEGYLEK